MTLKKYYRTLTQFLKKGRNTVSLGKQEQERARY